MIYLDSAATSLLKPQSVFSAMNFAMQNMASPGRGGHKPGILAAEECLSCRENLCRLFHFSNPENVVFTFNATHGLNIAINSVIKPGDKVLVSGWEHNSVMRPLYALGAKITIIDSPLFDSTAFINKAEQLIAQSDAVVCTHVSNVFGFILPVYELAALCRKHNKPLIIDASQSAGVLDIDAEKLGADFIAMPGHKGLLGPQGTGVLICKNDAKPLLYGGSGSSSLGTGMPDFLPDRLEAGTHNVHGIAGLNAGIKYILSGGTENLRRHERRLLDIFAGRCANVPGAKLFYSPDEKMQCGVLSVLCKNADCGAVGEILAKRGVCVRTGLHCAPSAHASEGTLERGTVRFSFSPFNTRREVIAAAEIFEKIMKNL